LWRRPDVNFFHQKQQSAARNAAKLLKNCANPLTEIGQDD
jgi:hypothetical protein